MNPELHHRWNAERTPSRGSDRDGRTIEDKEVAENKVTLRQVGPHKGKTDREN